MVRFLFKLETKDGAPAEPCPTGALATGSTWESGHFRWSVDATMTPTSRPCWSWRTWLDAAAPGAEACRHLPGRASAYDRAIAKKTSST